MSKVIIFFDFEVNGLAPESSVLSVAALKTHLTEGKFLFAGDFVRFYFPKEAFHADALKVHGITEDVIREKRTDQAWYGNFQEDLDFVDFVRGADLMVAHNYKFDSRYLPFKVAVEKTFCTMASNTLWRGKWPKLNETAKFYGVSLDEGRLHDAAYDTFLCYQIFREMYHRGLLPFLGEKNADG